MTYDYVGSFMDKGWLFGAGAAIGAVGCITCLVAPVVGVAFAIIGMNLVGFQLGWDVRGDWKPSSSTHTEKSEA